MRIAAGLIFAGAVSLCATGAAWSQTPATKSTMAPAAAARACSDAGTGKGALREPGCAWHRPRR